MEEMNRVLDLAKEADIDNDDWAYDLLLSIKNDFARGYLSAKLEEIGNDLSPNTEDYRYEVIESIENAYK